MKTAIDQWHAQERQQRSEELTRLNDNFKAVRADLERQILKMDRGRWQQIRPRLDRVRTLRGQAGFRMVTRVTRNMKEGRWYWRRISEDRMGRRAKTVTQMTECERIAEELVDLLEDKDATDEQIKQKMNALEQARYKARRELAKARQELRKELTPRQEAILLMLRALD
jgi:hypothetical protein